MSNFFFYCVFLLICILALPDLDRSWKPVRVCQLFLLVTILTSIALLRSVGFGNDDEAYIDIFRNVSSNPDFFSSLREYAYSDYNIELGFFILLNTITLFGNSHFLLFGVTAFLSVCLNVRSIRYFSPYLATSCLVYFSHFYLAKELNAIRAGLASAVLFYAAIEIHKHRYFKTFLAWLAGLSVHISAFFFILPAAIYVLKPSRRTLFFAALLSIIFSAFFGGQDLSRALSSFGFVGEKLELYLNADTFSHALAVADPVNIKNLFFIILAFIMWERLNSSYPTFYIAFIFFYCSSLIRLMFSDFAILAGRGYSIIAMFEYVVIPFILVALFGRVAGLFFVATYAFLMLWLNFNVNSGWSGQVDFFLDWNYF